MTYKRRSSKARSLHRLLGIGAAVFIIFMVLSGLTINHSNSLGLDQHQIAQPLLLDWYGLGEPQQIRSFEVGNDWLSFAGSQLYLNNDPVASVVNGVGAVSSNDVIIVAGSDELLLLDPAGNLIERSNWALDGAMRIESIGVTAKGAVVIESADQLWLADRELLNWNQAGETTTNPSWAKAAVAPEIFRKNIAQSYRGDGLILERVILDIHSGRIFGNVGVLVYDLLALSVAFMAISGVILWARGRRNGNRKPPRS